MYNKLYSYLVVLRKDNLETNAFIVISILQYFEWMYTDFWAVSYVQLRFKNFEGYEEFFITCLYLS